MPQLLQPPALWQWLPGLIFGFVILLALRRSQHILILPGLFVAAIALFYLWLALWEVPLAAAQSRGWLLGPFSAQALWSPPTVGMLATVHWPAIISQGTAIGAAVTTCFLLSRARSLP